MKVYRFQILLVRFQIEILCLLTLAPVNTMKPSVNPKQMVGISISEVLGDDIVVGSLAIRGLWSRDVSGRGQKIKENGATMIKERSRNPAWT